MQIGVHAAWLCDFNHARKATLKMQVFGKYVSPRSWQVPPPDQLRLDVDAAFNETTNSFAVGGIVRHHEGQPVMVFGKRIRKPTSVVYVELMAIDEGLGSQENMACISPK